MIEIQCTSCHTRYRIDERVLPDETPTFKCSRCGHVFNAEPLPARPRKPAPLRAVEKPKTPPSPPPEAEPESQPEPEAPPVESKAPEQSAQSAPPEEPEQPAQPPEENPLDRTFSRQRPEEIVEGENLSFDFGSEPKPGEDSPENAPEEPAHTEDHWEVGDAPETSADEPVPEPPPQAMPEEPVTLKTESRGAIRAARRAPAAVEFHEPEFTASQYAAPEPAPEESRKFGHRMDIPEEVALFASPKATHSSAWFLGLFVVIAILFAAASMAVHMEPGPVVRILSQAPRIGSNFQRPMVPAMLVALHDVRADYQQIKGGQTALLISGTAENVGSAPLHAVLLAVDLLDDGGKQVASNAAFCGNGLTARMVGEMTPREIEFLQRLDPQKNFAVAPSQTTPFLLVFIDPPRKVANLRIQVAKAVAAQSAPAPRS